MRNRKLDRALYGPTIYEITFGVILSISLGAALAISFLIFKPALTVKEMPKEDERIRGATYYVTGTADALRSKQWMRKRQMLIESTPGEVTLNEDELNMWFLSSTESGQKELEKMAKETAAADAAAAKAKAAGKTPAKSPKPAATAAAAPAAPAEETPAEAPPEELITYKAVNFRIRNGAMQVGVPTVVTTLGYQFPVVVQTRGGFEKRDDMYVFVPDELMIGSFPLHRFPHAVEYIMKKAMSSDALPPELLGAWKKVKTVVIDDKTLKLTI
ncbi:MAG: hypothetical protein QM715_05290 [Nibricoccus sp.]